jgi:uncharacterized membrane protein YeaQ/YmgE (transglycosylase-associated protein family)
MNITFTGFIVLLIIAGLCGALGRSIGGGTPGGFFVSIVVGFVGAFLGVYLANTLDLPKLFVVSIDRHPFPIVWSIIGAALFVAIIHLISGGYGRSPRRRRYT